MTKQEFIQWEANSRDTIDLKRCYVHLAGDLVAGLLLSQIIYWNLPARDGKSKLRIVKHGKDWIAKSREDWWAECCVTPKQADRAIKRLVGKGFVEIGHFMFDGFRTCHLHLRLENLLDAITEYTPALYERGNAVLTKGEDRS